MKKKLGMVLALGLCMSLLLTACGGSTKSTNSASPASNAATSSSKSSKDTMTVSWSSGEPGNLHPYATLSAGKAVCATPVFERLFDLDDKGNIVPLLAESWDFKDPKMLIVKLRKNVKFHNGETMKASDVKFTFQQVALSPKAKPTVSTMDFDKIEVVDDYTVKFPMTAVNSSILAGIANGETWIVSEKAYKELGDKFQQTPVGTGAFKISKWQKGDRIEYERFDDYWNTKSPLKKLVIRFIPEPSQALVELETGGVDFVIDPQAGDIAKAKNNNKLQVVSAVSLRNVNLVFNHSSDPMRKKQVRQAIAYAIDRTAIAKAIFEDTGFPAVSPLTKDAWGFNKELETKYPYTFNVEKAKSLLKEAGYPDGFKVTLYTANRSYQVALTEILQNSLAKIGITVQVKISEINAMQQFLGMGQGYDMYISDNLSSSAEPLQAIYRGSHPKFAFQNSSHFLFYKDNDNAVKYGQALDAIQLEMDDTKKRELVKNVQDIFIEDLPWAPIATKGTFNLALKNLKGFRYTADLPILGNSFYFE